MTEEKKDLPVVHETIVPAEVKRDPNLPAEFKDADKLKSAVASKLGVDAKNVHVEYGPVGQLLHDGARQFLADEHPEFLARLDKYKFGG